MEPPQNDFVLVAQLLVVIPPLGNGVWPTQPTAADRVINRRVHICHELPLGEGTIVDADVVDGSGKKLPPVGITSDPQDACGGRNGADLRPLGRFDPIDEDSFGSAVISYRQKRPGSWV